MARARSLSQGIVGSGIGFSVMAWCIQVRGPLYVSMFSPLLLVVVAIVGWAILGEKIRVGRYVILRTTINCNILILT